MGWNFGKFLRGISRFTPFGAVINFVESAQDNDNLLDILRDIPRNQTSGLLEGFGVNKDKAQGYTNLVEKGGLGFLMGGIPGAVAGVAGETINQKNELAQIEQSLKNLDITQAELENKRSGYETYLASWQNSYDLSVESAKQNAQAQVNQLKDAWGLTNATLANRETSGRTAQLLSQQDKNRVIAYAGQDMRLTFDNIELGVADAFKTDIGKLATLGNNNVFGIYERNLMDQMETLRQNRQTQQTNLNNTNLAIEQNRELQEQLKKDKRQNIFS